MASEKGASSATLSAYERDINRFQFFLKSKQLTVQQVGLREVRSFLAYLRAQGLTERSIARRASSLRQLFLFLLREEVVDADPTELIQIRLKNQKLPKHLTREEILSLLQNLNGDDPLEVRDRAIVELWYATGCRVSELSDLKNESFDWKDRLVKVIGKGNRERLVPIHEECIRRCLKYQQIRHEWVRKNILKEPKQFFLTPKGNRMTRQSLWKIFKDRAKQAGIKRTLWPHMMRHTFATHLLRGGADLRVVQEFLGHRSILTTEVYTHLDAENLKVMQLKYHPRG